MRLLSLVLLASAVVSQSEIAEACDHYASPVGGGDGLTQGSPFKIADFWKVARPGMTLCLLNGVYTGADSMINPPLGLKGTANARITVRALNDGGVRINGEGLNIPVYLATNEYFILEGFDAHNSGNSVIRLSRGADNNIVRRVCAWDANTNINDAVFEVSYGQGNLIEDICGFGSARKIVQYFASYGPFTVRRAWGMWNEHAAFGEDWGSPKEVFNGVYDSANATFENVVGTWDGQANGGYGILGTDGINISYQSAVEGYCSNLKYLGSIGYLKSGNTVPDLVGVAYGSRSSDCIEFKDVVLDAGTFSQLPIDASGFDGGATGLANCPLCDRKLTNITEIGTRPSSIAGGGNGWQVSNRASGLNVADVPNIWNGSGSSGARVCYRYQDRVKTNKPLWPWPMDQRIRAALIASGRNPDSVFDGPGNGLTQLMERRFGAIPAECRDEAPQMDTIAPLVQIHSPADGSEVLLRINK